MFFLTLSPYIDIDTHIFIHLVLALERGAGLCVADTQRNGKVCKGQFTKDVHQSSDFYTPSPLQMISKVVIALRRSMLRF